MAEKKKQHVSPVNGQPLPRGRQFTSETAREARRKRTEKEQKQKSITKAFLEMMGETFTDKNGKVRTGAEVIAYSIVQGAMKGNARMVEIALDLTGETPAKNINLYSEGILAELIDGLRCEDGIHKEAVGTNADMAEGATETN